MHKEFLIPVGENTPNLALPGPYQIAGIRVDNPSGSWLRLMPINQFVPPWREAWSIGVTPGAATVSLEFTESQAGSLSTLEGNPITITLYDVLQPYSEGRPSGSGARQATIPPSLTAVALVSTNSGSTLISMLNEPNRRIVIRRIALAPDFQTGTQVPQPLSNSVMGQFRLAGGGSGTPEWYLAISPESPFAEASFEDGVFALGAGEDLEIVVICEPYGTRQFLFALAQYYLEQAL